MIKVNEDYVIDVDQYNFTVKFDRHRKWLNEKTGVEVDVFDTVGHYSSLESALYACLKDMQVRKLSDEDMSLAKALKVVRDTTRRFTGTMNRVLREEKK